MIVAPAGTPQHHETATASVAPAFQWFEYIATTCSSVETFVLRPHPVIPMKPSRLVNPRLPIAAVAGTDQSRVVQKLSRNAYVAHHVQPSPSGIHRCTTIASKLLFRKFLSFRLWIGFKFKLSETIEVKPSGPV